MFGSPGLRSIDLGKGGQENLPSHAQIERGPTDVKDFLQRQPRVQATALLPHLLQDDLGLNEHRVLVALAARMAYKSGPTTQTLEGTCFPSLLTLCRDTLLSDRAIRYALDRLIDNGYITKSTIPGTKIRRGNMTWKFKHNRYHLVPEVWDSVGSLFGSKTEQVQLGESVAAPPTSRGVLVSEVAVELSGVPRPKYRQTEPILALLRKTFPRHPTWAVPGADSIMREAVRVCIDAAGSGERCQRVIQDLCSLPANKLIRAAIAKSAKLGGYIKHSFEGWIADNNAPIEEKEEEEEEEKEEEEEEKEEEEEEEGEEEEGEKEEGEKEEGEKEEGEEERGIGRGRGRGMGRAGLRVWHTRRRLR